jgi:hypothetical protein
VRTGGLRDVVHRATPARLVLAAVLTLVAASAVSAAHPRLVALGAPGWFTGAATVLGWLVAAAVPLLLVAAVVLWLLRTPGD